MSIRFHVQHADGLARAGVLETAHGAVETPVFMPVGTQATVKGLTPQQLEEAGARLILANTYHLTLRPGDEVIAEMGGLHRFMNWNGPILTDSGGFQIYSLALSRRIDDRAAVFQSHIDGARLELSPERAVAIQENLGADIAMC
ncbi:MAG TPA: tRNA guanosine(34) transglycosylase Tgt, partial [Gemmataceae bacterium]|nr:tRNA guanosine(34) transglycosylase Tgt [Gemmataceae bacterium]